MKKVAEVTPAQGAEVIDCAAMQAGSGGPDHVEH
jgi:hypothetical protein